jgi:hypothetical protein
MGHKRSTIGVLLLLTLSGCAAGAPGAPAAGPAPTSSTTAATAPATSAPPTTAPAVRRIAAADVAECGTDCAVVVEVPLADGGRFAALQGGATGQGQPRALLVHRPPSGPDQVAEPATFAHVQTAVCAKQRCAAVLDVGAHGTAAVVLDLSGKVIVVAGRAGAGTPEGAVADLDKDGRLDIALRESTEDPAYAAAPRYWQTWRDDGGPGPAGGEDDPNPSSGSLVRTGCGPATLDDVKEPTALLTGPCPPS